MNLDCEKGHSLAEFVQNMAEAIAWCASRPRPWSPFATFRSPDIAPEFGSNSCKSWIQSVAKQRRRALGGGRISLQKRVYRHEGRLLAYFPDDNLACGVAEAETGGFFTTDNVPPWDTWIAYLHEDRQTNYLVAWVAGPDGDDGRRRRSRDPRGVRGMGGRALSATDRGIGVAGDRARKAGFWSEMSGWLRGDHDQTRVQLLRPSRSLTAVPDKFQALIPRSGWRQRLSCRTRPGPRRR